MENVRVPAALWLRLAQGATLIAIWSRISALLAEIAVNNLAQSVIVQGRSRAQSFLASNGAAPLAFVARTETERSDLMPVRLHGMAATQRALREICHGTGTALRSLPCVVGEATARLAVKNDSK